MSKSKSKFKHVESPTLRAMLTGEIKPTPDLLRLAVDLTYLQNEYSERCDGEDFAVGPWEEMQEALERASQATDNADSCLTALREYWARWKRYSTIY